MLLAVVSPRTTVAGRSPLDKPPAVLVDRAQQILVSIGYTDPIADSASGFSSHQAYLRWIDSTTKRPELRPVRIAEVVDLLAAGVKERPRPRD